MNEPHSSHTSAGYHELKQISTVATVQSKSPYSPPTRVLTVQFMDELRSVLDSPDNFYTCSYIRSTDFNSC